MKDRKQAEGLEPSPEFLLDLEEWKTGRMTTRDLYNRTLNRYRRQQFRDEIDRARRRFDRGWDPGMGSYYYESKSEVIETSEVRDEG